MDLKALQSAVKDLKDDFSFKFLLVENAAKAEVPLHFTKDGFLNFESFAWSVRTRYPFGDSERMIFLVPTELLLTEIVSGTTSTGVHAVDTKEGVAAISISKFKSDAPESAFLLKKVLRSIIGKFYGLTSKCGVLGDAPSLALLLKKPDYFCPRDKLDLRKMVYGN